jgi:hypothetical protein
VVTKQTLQHFASNMDVVMRTLPYVTLLPSSAPILNFRPKYITKDLPLKRKSLKYEVSILGDIENEIMMDAMWRWPFVNGLMIIRIT